MVELVGKHTSLDATACMAAQPQSRLFKNMPKNAQPNLHHLSAGISPKGQKKRPNRYPQKNEDIDVQRPKKRPKAKTDFQMLEFYSQKQKRDENIFSPFGRKFLVIRHQHWAHGGQLEGNTYVASRERV